MNVEEVIPTNAPPDFRQSSASAVYKGIELANTVVSIVKVVGELLSTVPYIKSLSSVEFKTNEKRCLEIIDKALRMAQALYEQLAEVARSSHREKLVRLERHLGLAALYASLQKHRSRSTRMAVRTFDSIHVRYPSTGLLFNDLTIYFSIHSARYMVVPMSTLLAVSKFLGGRSCERRRVDSTCNYILIKPLGSANDVVPLGAPKIPRSNKRCCSSRRSQKLAI
ncbi:hypothetical protein BDN70DRAFT_889093 [Pholiota conissans]|uniref:Uncharacterized protein n=1 Tax=Pholiota conissans TaxID=109636 RepID=A0A9P6CRU7_9AGAR|nr:hypothetical protein BDN70DRAFT_889093 [Pholiota conissans]